MDRTRPAEASGQSAAAVSAVSIGADEKWDVVMSVHVRDAEYDLDEGVKVRGAALGEVEVGEEDHLVDAGLQIEGESCPTVTISG